MKDTVPFYFDTRSVSGTCTTISGENNLFLCKHTNSTTIPYLVLNFQITLNCGHPNPFLALKVPNLALVTIVHTCTIE